MAGEQLLLDPTGEATGTQLDITDAALGYYLISHDYPDPELEVVQVSSIDTEGANPAAGKHQPRTITIVVRCVQPSGGTPSIGTMVSNLQRKIGKLFREGGTYRRVLPSGDSITFDVLRFGARISVPADKRWITRGTADVTITLTCQPGGRGPLSALTLTPVAATAGAPFVWTTTGVKGDMPGRGQMVVSNATNAKTLFIWGLRSRYYDLGNRLLYEAEDCTAISATLNAGYSGASGVGANKVMRHSNVGTSGSEAFSVVNSGVAPGHLGTYRVLARVQADSGNTGIVSVWARWTQKAIGSIEDNVKAPIVTSAGAAIKGSWVLADLGLVTVPVPRFGGLGWSLKLCASSTVSTDDLDWDWVVLVPVDEGSGRLVSVAGPVPSNGSVVLGSDAIQMFTPSAGTGYFDGAYEGDYLQVPPAGAEGRAIELVVILAGPTSTAGNLTGTVADAVNLDAITATLHYWPRYLSIPAP